MPDGGRDDVSQVWSLPASAALTGSTARQWAKARSPNASDTVVDRPGSSHTLAKALSSLGGRSTVASTWPT